MRGTPQPVLLGAGCVVSMLGRVLQLVRLFGGSCWHLPFERDGVVMLCYRNVAHAQTERVDAEHTRNVRLCWRCREQAWNRFMARLAEARRSE